jgi:hypothetical protein
MKYKAEFIQTGISILILIAVFVLGMNMGEVEYKQELAVQGNGYYVVGPGGGALFQLGLPVTECVMPAIEVVAKKKGTNEKVH